MKLFVCWGTMPIPIVGHPCHDAYSSLRAAGHDPEVIRSYGWDTLPDVFNQAEGRKLAREITGKSTVPLLQLDDGEVIFDSKNITTWAEQHPASETTQ
jgi:hypothetical protein